MSGSTDRSTDRSTNRVQPEARLYYSPPSTRASQSTLKSSHFGGSYTQWIAARSTRPGQCPCFTRLFDRYHIGSIRRGLPEIDDFVAHAGLLQQRSTTSLDHASECGPCPIVVNRRFGMRLHRVTHGMYPAAGGGVPSIWARLVSPTRVLPRLRLVVPS